MRVWAAIGDCVRRTGGAVLVTVAEVQGSAPREAGARMVVAADGSFSGTIGGGTLEWRAIADAQRMLAGGSQVAGSHPPPGLRPPSPTRGEGDGAPSSSVSDAESAAPSPSPLVGEGGRSPGGGQGLSVDRASPARQPNFRLLSLALGPELGQCCGGRVKLALEAFRTAALPAIDGFAAAEAAGRFSTECRPGAPRRLLPDAAPADFALDGERLIETFGANERTLYLYGAGHVGRALVLALAPLPFRVVWIDSRRDDFPAAVPANVTMVAPADPVATLASATPGAFVLIMTHSHALDLALCEAALRSADIGYVGVIGSATKRARFTRRLADVGIAADKLAGLVCPVGSVGLKSKLPAAIAAGVAVELLLRDEAARAGIARRQPAAPDVSAARRAGP
ncbi:MAG: xanthine dehydrogenase accessory protein XdhC [Ancalomicrobiaceae bacterium]|nr:xanthine dehydrogenase accessory protein XdhC [Ancalomicrobiaceae bacterium]